MITNPTNEHREQAREIADLFILTFKRLDPSEQSASAELLVKRIASALSSRDTEVREVLAGLIHHHVCHDDGSVTQHWCQKESDGYFECHADCQAARTLYARLRPPEKSLPGE